LIEHPLIDHAVSRNARACLKEMSAFRKKLAHFSVDLPGPKSLLSKKIWRRVAVSSS